MKYSKERKQHVQKKMLESSALSIAELSETEGISEATLYNWRTELRNQGHLLPDGCADPAGWSSRDKFAAVLATASMNETEKSAYCRERGIYPADIDRWRDACEQANDWEQSKEGEIKQALKSEKQRVKELERENRRNEKALAETAALLVLSKKVQAIWGDEVK